MERQHLFTIEEVNELIPTLELIMERLQRHGFTLREQLSAVAAQLGTSVEQISTAQLLELRPALATTFAEIDRLVTDIGACGGELKGLDLGLVDFPAERDGALILLCWQYGEKEITHYHTPDGGFAGRQPLGGGPEPTRYIQ